MRVSRSAQSARGARTIACAIDGGSCGSKQADGSYRGDFGDHGTLVLTGGAYKLTETDSTVIAFRANGGSFYGDQGRKILKKGDADLVAKFNDYVNRGVDGSGFEHGLWAAKLEPRPVTP